MHSNAKYILDQLAQKLIGNTEIAYRHYRGWNWFSLPVCRHSFGIRGWLHRHRRRIPRRPRLSGRARHRLLRQLGRVLLLRLRDEQVPVLPLLRLRRQQQQVIVTDELLWPGTLSLVYLTSIRLTSIILISIRLNSIQLPSIIRISICLTSIQLTSIQLTSIQLTSIQLTSIQLTSIQLTSIWLTSNQLTSIQLTSIQITLPQFTRLTLDNWRDF